MLSEKDTCKYRDLRPMEKNMNAYMEANYGIQIQNFWKESKNKIFKSLYSLRHWLKTVYDLLGSSLFVKI